MDGRREEMHLTAKRIEGIGHGCNSAFLETSNIMQTLTNLILLLTDFVELKSNVLKCKHSAILFYQFSPSVCLSVCLSNVGTVSKRMDISSHFLTMVGQSLF